MSILIPKIRTVKNQKSILIPKIRTFKNQQSPGSTTKNHRHNSNNRLFMISTLAHVARCKQSARPLPHSNSNLSVCHLNLQKVMGLQESGAVVQHSAWSMRWASASGFKSFSRWPISPLIIFPHSQIQHHRQDRGDFISPSSVASLTSLPRWRLAPQRLFVDDRQQKADRWRCKHHRRQLSSSQRHYLIPHSGW